VGFEELLAMEVRGILYIHPMYSPLALVMQKQTRVGISSREETNQMSAWQHSEGT
jgi:hypothetical protein